MTTQYIKKSFSGLYWIKIGLFSYHWFTPYDAGILQRKNHIPIRNFQGWKNPTPNFYKYEKIKLLIPFWHFSLHSSAKFAKSKQVCKTRTWLLHKISVKMNFHQLRRDVLPSSSISTQINFIVWRVATLLKTILSIIGTTAQFSLMSFLLCFSW